MLFPLLLSCGLSGLVLGRQLTSLGDHAVIGDVVQLLSGKNWTVSQGATEVAAVVPGDLLTDLQLGGIIGDPLYESNYEGTVWDTGNWTYSLTFTAETAGTATQMLVFDGVKMIADVTLNGVYLGYTSDQFLRYSYDVTSALSAPGSANVLTLSFAPSSDARNGEERWMSCSVSAGGLRTPRRVDCCFALIALGPMRTGRFLSCVRGFDVSGCAAPRACLKRVWRWRAPTV